MKTTITFSILIWINSSGAKDNEAEIFKLCDSQISRVYKGF